MYGHLKAIHPETIVNGIRKTGVCPLNKYTIEIVEDAESQSSTSSATLPAVCSESPCASFGQSNFNSSRMIFISRVVVIIRSFDVAFFSCEQEKRCNSFIVSIHQDVL